MNDSTVLFVTNWLNTHNIKHEVLKDLSLKIYMELGSPRLRTYVGRHEGNNIYLECNSNRDSGQKHYFFLILSTPGHWSSRIEG